MKSLRTSIAILSPCFGTLYSSVFPSVSTLIFSTNFFPPSSISKLKSVAWNMKNWWEGPSESIASYQCNLARGETCVSKKISSLPMQTTSHSNSQHWLVGFRLFACLLLLDAQAIWWIWREAKTVAFRYGDRSKMRYLFYNKAWTVNTRMRLIDENLFMGRGLFEGGFIEWLAY